MNYKAAPQHSSEYAGKKKDHYHNPDGSFSFTRKQAKERKEKKQAAPKMKYGAAAQMGHSPAEMGHSPAEMGHSPAEMSYSPMENQNKGYAKQEKYNLLHDNPVAKHASWMSKHATQSKMGSPLKNHCMNK